MSVFKHDTLVASYPAYNVFERTATISGFTHIDTDDILAVEVKHRNGGFYRTYLPGSVASYALEYNECPFEARERALANKHPLYYIIARGSVMTDHKREAEKVVRVTFGMKVIFQGKPFTIEEDFNNNLKFVAA